MTSAAADQLAAELVHMTDADVLRAMGDAQWPSDDADLIAGECERRGIA